MICLFIYFRIVPSVLIVYVLFCVFFSYFNIVSNPPTIQPNLGTTQTTNDDFDDDDDDSEEAITDDNDNNIINIVDKCNEIFS